MNNKVLVFLFIAFVVGDVVCASNILTSSKEISRYEKKVLRLVSKYEKEDYTKVENLTVFYCNYVGELVSDSLLSSSFLSNIEMCFGVFPRKRFLFGETLFFPEDKDYVVSYVHWNKTRGISHLNDIINKDERLLLELCHRFNIQYCLYLGRDDAWTMDCILIDKDGKSYYFNHRNNDVVFGLLNEYVNELLKEWKEKD